MEERTLLTVEERKNGRKIMFVKNISPAPGVLQFLPVTMSGDLRASERHTREAICDA
jgi:hypothetical protein